MPDPTPTPKPGSLAEQIANGGKATTSAAKEKRQLEKYSESQLRYLYRAGQLTQEGWQYELEQRGQSAEQARQEIKDQLTTGYSTAKGKEGQLTAAEQANIDAYKKEVYDTGDVDSFENPDRAAQGLSSVSGREGEQPGRTVGTGTAGSGSGGSGSKLPKTPEEELRDKQQAARDKAELEARMQRMAEDQYILDSGGKVQRNAEGRLESRVQDGKYEAVVPHQYDAKTGLVSEQEAVGWRSATAGNTLDPRGAVWNDPNVSPAMWEDLRRMNWADRSNWIRENLGREPTASDLMSGPGGQFMFGDKDYYANKAAFAATGKILPGMGTAVNSFSDAGPVSQQLSFGQKTPPAEMNAAEYNQFRTLGDFVGSKTNQTLGSMVGLNNDMGTATGQTSTSASADSLGGVGSDRYNAEAQARFGEMQDQQTYGTDALPVAMRRKFWEDLNNGTIGDAQQYFATLSGRGRRKVQEPDDDTLYQALGGTNIAGMEQPRPLVLTGTLPQFGGTGAQLPTAPATPNLTPAPAPAAAPSRFGAGDTGAFASNWMTQPGGPLHGKRFDRVLGQWVNKWPEIIEEEEAYDIDYGDPRNLWGARGRPYSGARMMANGGSFMTDGEVRMVDDQGKVLAIAGEAGPEAINVTPTRPQGKTLPKMGGVQPTPVDMIREQAKLLRPRVAFKVA
jgi:hypothetical protein